MPIFNPDKKSGKQNGEYCGTCRYLNFPIGRRGFVCKHSERAGDLSEVEFADGCDLWESTAPRWGNGGTNAG